MRNALLTALQQRAIDRGFELFGVVDTLQFDKSQPLESRCGRELRDCGTAVVVGCGGAHEPSEAAVRELQDVLRTAGLRARAVPPVRSAVSFAALGEAAGFGTVSPVIHRLLHPRYGPWVAVAGVVLVEGQPFGPIPDASIAHRFQPCCKCARPCVTACPTEVHDGHGGQRLDRCHDQRQAGRCASSCHVLRTCPVGADLRAPATVEQLRHRRDSLRLARRHARGLWWALRRAIGL
ncbi:MAG: hypothetical protein AB7O97_07190 [Planctomycetota bacterium]